MPNINKKNIPMPKERVLKEIEIWLLENGIEFIIKRNSESIETNANQIFAGDNHLYSLDKNFDIIDDNDDDEEFYMVYSKEDVANALEAIFSTEGVF
jgi:hypothetical protein